MFFALFPTVELALVGFARSVCQAAISLREEASANLATNLLEVVANAHLLNALAAVTDITSRLANA